jgi:hypothetical protein
MDILATTLAVAVQPTTWATTLQSIPTPTPVATAIVPRQLWNPRTATTTTAPPHCTPFTLPSGGLLQFGDSAITLTTTVVFQPQCTDNTPGRIIDSDLRDDFYASTIPMTFVIAAATVIAWILVIMLVVTPRTALFGIQGPAPAALVSGHGMIGGANGPSTFAGSGTRPWLQKVAALLVAISLTIATADFFGVAYRQYVIGYMDASEIRTAVLETTEIKVTRLVSDVFLWLAQVQTLIRLFPRHKEKVLIKWIGFALILFDSVFACLNAFHIGTPGGGRHFVEAIPALSYLFQLSVGLLYAAWVIYFALSKYRYAFYHPRMRSICVIAVLSLVAILTPVVFFVTDISNFKVAGWGDYVRWVGACAASVIVWEWVDRIEALERDEKKDGILGREVFDGDEMLDLDPNDQGGWGRNRRRRRGTGNDTDQNGNTSKTPLEHGLNNVAQHFRPKPPVPAPQHFPMGRAYSSSEPTVNTQVPAAAPNAAITWADTARHSMARSGIVPPVQAPTPVSRADTTSAASTVYIVQYDAAPDVPQPVRRRVDHSRNATRPSRELALQEKELADVVEEEDELRRIHSLEQGKWHAVSNPFKRKRTSPPKEVQEAKAVAEQATGPATPPRENPIRTLRSRLPFFSSAALESSDAHQHNRSASNRNHRKEEGELPVIVVPAPNRHLGRQIETAILNEKDTLEVPSRSHSDDAAAARPRSALSTSAAAANSADAGDRRSATHLSATTRTSPASGPPRADDISPVAGQTGQVIIIPAPPRRSPTALSASSTNHTLSRTAAHRNSSPLDGSEMGSRSG